MVNGKFTLDVLDLLIIIVVTVLFSSILTGFILNFQYLHLFATALVRLHFFSAQSSSRLSAQTLLSLTHLP